MTLQGTNLGKIRYIKKNKVLPKLKILINFIILTLFKLIISTFMFTIKDIINHSTCPNQFQ